MWLAPQYSQLLEEEVRVEEFKPQNLRLTPQPRVDHRVTIDQLIKECFNIGSMKTITRYYTIYIRYIPFFVCSFLFLFPPSENTQCLFFSFFDSNLWRNSIFDLCSFTRPTIDTILRVLTLKYLQQLEIITFKSINSNITYSNNNIEWTIQDITLRIRYIDIIKKNAWKKVVFLNSRANLSSFLI